MQIDHEHNPGQPRQAPGTPAGQAVWHMLRAHCPTRTVEEQLQELFKDAKPCTLPPTTFARAVDRALRACFALLKFTDHIQVAYVEGSTGKSTYTLIRERICLIYIADGWTLLVRTTGRSTGPGLRTTSPTRTPRSSAVMWWKHFAHSAPAAQTTMLCFMMAIVRTLRRRFSMRK
jgi:hypothetical protein